MRGNGWWWERRAVIQLITLFILSFSELKTVSEINLGFFHLPTPKGAKEEST